MYVDHTDPREYKAVKGAVIGAPEGLKRDTPRGSSSVRGVRRGVREALPRGRARGDAGGDERLLPARVHQRAVAVRSVGGDADAGRAEDGYASATGDHPGLTWEFLAGKYLATAVIVVLGTLLGVAYSCVALEIRYLPSSEG